MNTTIIIITIVVCAVLVLLLLSSNKKEKSKKSSDSSSDKPNKASNINKDKTKRDDVFKFMEFDRIQDNMIIQNNGKRYTMAIKCKGINYDLMSEVEQMSVEQGFITFLNTLLCSNRFISPRFSLSDKLTNGLSKCISAICTNFIFSLPFL